jgi:hypothetical protein
MGGLVVMRFTRNKTGGSPMRGLLRAVGMDGLDGGSPARPRGPREREGGGGGRWHRDALVAFWALGFALLASRVAWSFERLVAGLARVPTPHSTAVPSPVSAAALSPGDATLLEARRLIEQGDAAGTLAASGRVTPEDPAYSSAPRVRHQAERTLGEGGPHR